MNCENCELLSLLLESVRAELAVSNTIRDAARAECNRMLEENRELRRVARRQFEAER